MTGYLSKIVSRSLGKTKSGANLENLYLPDQPYSNRFLPSLSEKTGISYEIPPEFETMDPSTEHLADIRPKEHSSRSAERTAPSSSHSKRTFIHTDIPDDRRSVSHFEPPISSAVENRKDLKIKTGPGASHGTEKSSGNSEVPNPGIQPVAPDVFEHSYRIEMKSNQKKNMEPSEFSYSQKKEKQPDKEGGLHSLSSSTSIELNPDSEEMPLKNHLKSKKISVPKGSVNHFSNEEERNFISRSDPADVIQYRSRASLTGRRHANKLVIGKIRVEVLPPAMQQVKTETHPPNGRPQSVKPKPKSTSRFNLRFGLGQI